MAAAFLLFPPQTCPLVVILSVTSLNTLLGISGWDVEGTRDKWPMKWKIPYVIFLADRSPFLLPHFLIYFIRSFIHAFLRRDVHIICSSSPQLTVCSYVGRSSHYHQAKF